MVVRVTIVVPMYRCESTIAETLASVQRQSFTDWELIAVDDGAAAARPIVAAHAAGDPRIRLIGDGVNRGYAHALNTGIRAGVGELIAPLDSDDLWTPSKLAAQIAVMDAAGPDCGFVYCGHRRIDARSDVLYDAPLHAIDGWAYLPLIVCNLVGNGSTMLMRRTAYEDAGGYLEDPTARSSLDVLIQLMIARRWRVACAPQNLVLYRLSPDSVSSNRLRSLGARLRVLEILAARHPETPQAALRQRRAETQAQRGCLLLGAGALGAAAGALAAAARDDVGLTLRGIRMHLRSVVSRRLGRVSRPKAGGGDAGPAPLPAWRRRQVLRAQAMEAAFRRDVGCGPDHADQNGGGAAPRRQDA